MSAPAPPARRRPRPREVDALARIDPAALAAEPFRHDMLALLRLLERSAPDKPRIGEGTSLSQEVVRLVQDPYLAFPASNVARFAPGDTRGDEVSVRFLGLLGPQGAMPLAVTEEAFGWFHHGDEAFARFLDVFNNRFLQLYFRAFANARPIAHRDRPEADRFAGWLASVPGFRLDQAPPAEALTRLAFAGLLAPRVKSAARLRALLAGVLAVPVEIEPFVGEWLTLEADERNALGRAAATLGSDAMLGGRVYSVDTRIRIRVRTPTLAVYEDFLPGGAAHRRLAGLVHFYVGLDLTAEVELSLPAGAAPRIRLGSAGRLGYAGWVAPAAAPAPGAVLSDARFVLEPPR